MATFDVPIKIYKRQTIKIVAEDLEEAKSIIKKQLGLQRQRFEFEDIEDAEETKEIPYVEEKVKS